MWKLCRVPSEAACGSWPKLGHFSRGVAPVDKGVIQRGARGIMRQRPTLLARAVAVAALLVSTPGCSFIFVRPPSSGDGRIASTSRGGDCTSSRLAPGFDTALGALEVVRTGMAVAADDSVYSDPKQPLSRGADIGLGLGFTALFVGSAIYGFVNTGRCSSQHSGGDAHDPGLDERQETWGDNAQDRSSSRPATPAGAPSTPASTFTAGAPTPSGTPFNGTTSGDVSKPQPASVP